MKFFAAAFLVLASSLTSFHKTTLRRYTTPNARSRRCVAEKGIKTGFIEYLSPLGVIFRPVREWKRVVERSSRIAALSHGIRSLSKSRPMVRSRYSIGNSIYSSER
jgi:hypothetical protein